MVICWFCALSATCLLQISNIIEWPWARAGAPYVAGVFCLLLLSGLQFISLALPSHASDPPREPQQ
jgi:hypothetical protein